MLPKENTSNKALQITLIAITVIGIGLFISSYYPTITSTIGYCGIGTATVSLVSLIIFRSYSLSELDRAIDSCKSFSDMEAIFTKSTMKVSLFGTRQLIVKGIGGSSTLDHFARRVEKEIAKHLVVESKRISKMATGKTFIYKDSNEEECGSRIVDSISNLFYESEEIINKKNLCTKIYYWTPRIFKTLICYDGIRADLEDLRE